MRYVIQYVATALAVIVTAAILQASTPIQRIPSSAVAPEVCQNDGPVIAAGSVNGSDVLAVTCRDHVVKLLVVRP